MLRTLALICIATPALAGEPVETREIVLSCGSGFTVDINPVTYVTYIGGQRLSARTEGRTIIIKDTPDDIIRIDLNSGAYTIRGWDNRLKSSGVCSQTRWHEDADQPPRG